MIIILSMVDPLITYLQLFRDITVKDQAIITDLASVRNVAAGEVLLRSGHVARELFFIVKGILKIVTVNEKGVEVTQFFLKENRFCTILRSFEQGIATEESIVAACDTALVVFSKDKLQSLFNKLPYCEELIGGIIRQGLLDKIQTRNAYMGEDATSRYKKFMAREPDIALRVPLSDVASYLGITQQSLSRIRRNIR